MQEVGRDEGAESKTLVNSFVMKSKERDENYGKEITAKYSVNKKLFWREVKIKMRRNGKVYRTRSGVTGKIKR